MTTASAKRILTVGAAIGGLAVIVYLALFDPTEWPAPQCMFHTLTGYDCPGCGTQRAVHALFSGDVGGAWHIIRPCFSWCLWRGCMRGRPNASTA